MARRPAIFYRKFASYTDGETFRQRRVITIGETCHPWLESMLKEFELRNMTPYERALLSAQRTGEKAEEKKRHRFKVIDNV